MDKFNYILIRMKNTSISEFEYLIEQNITQQTEHLIFENFKGEWKPYNGSVGSLGTINLCTNKIWDAVKEYKSLEEFFEDNFSDFL